MNRTQLRYALDALHRIFISHQKKIVNRYRKGRPPLTDEEKMKVIRDGYDITLTEAATLDTKLREAFDFTEHEEEKGEKSDSCKKELEQLRVHYDNLRVEIALGTKEKIKEALKKFEGWEW